jgi:hypothetical protein
MRKSRKKSASCGEHDDLVQRAAFWLKKARRCNIILTEAGGTDEESGKIERADAIGWIRPHVSLLVECKTSVADFRADAKKPHRQKGGMGVYRYFLAPTDILEKVEIPEGWGVLKPWGKNSCRIVKRSSRFTEAAEGLEERVLFWTLAKNRRELGLLQRAMTRVAKKTVCPSHWSRKNGFCFRCWIPYGYPVKTV